MNKLILTLVVLASAQIFAAKPTRARVQFISVKYSVGPADMFIVINRQKTTGGEVLEMLSVGPHEQFQRYTVAKSSLADLDLVYQKSRPVVAIVKGIRGKTPDNLSFEAELSRVSLTQEAKPIGTITPSYCGKNTLKSRRAENVRVTEVCLLSAFPELVQ